MAIKTITDNDSISLASLQRSQKGDTIAVVMEVAQEVHDLRLDRHVEAKTEMVTRLFRVSERVGKVGRATGGTIFTLRDIVDERQKVTVRSRGKLPKTWVYVRRVSEGTNARAGRVETPVKAVKAPKVAPQKSESTSVTTAAELVESI